MEFGSTKAIFARAKQLMTCCTCTDYDTHVRSTLLTYLGQDQKIFDLSDIRCRRVTFGDDTKFYLIHCEMIDDAKTYGNNSNCVVIQEAEFDEVFILTWLPSDMTKVDDTDKVKLCFAIANAFMTFIVEDADHDAFTMSYMEFAIINFRDTYKYPNIRDMPKTYIMELLGHDVMSHHGSYVWGNQDESVEDKTKKNDELLTFLLADTVATDQNSSSVRLAGAQARFRRYIQNQV